MEGRQRRKEKWGFLLESFQLLRFIDREKEEKIGGIRVF